MDTYTSEINMLCLNVMKCGKALKIWDKIIWLFWFVFFLFRTFSFRYWDMHPSLFKYLLDDITFFFFYSRLLTFYWIKLLWKLDSLHPNLFTDVQLLTAVKVHSAAIFSKQDFFSWSEMWVLFQYREYKIHFTSYRIFCKNSVTLSCLCH